MGPDRWRRDRSWHVVGRHAEALPPTARLFLDHLIAPDGDAAEPFHAAVSRGSDG